MSEWISVKKRLPDAYEEVLLTNSHAHAIGYYDQASRIWRCRLLQDDVTHWMPLPELPK